MSEIHEDVRVVYIPPHAAGDRTHRDCERGRVSSIAPNGAVFVKFDGPVSRLGWQGATAMLCERRYLEVE